MHAGVMRMREVCELLNTPLPGGLDPDRRVAALDCRPARAQGSDVFFVFEEFFEYQRWFRREEVAAALQSGGPRLVVTDRLLPGLPMPQLLVPDAARACGLVCGAFYGNPDLQIPLVGVTGTNGKTSTVQLIAHLLWKLAGSGGSIGTLGTWLDGSWIEPGDYTTGLAVETCRKLRRLADAGARGVAIEVSSHGLALQRVAGLRFAGGVLTQLSRDHLDFHGSPEAYRAAKRRLFESLDREAFAVLNADDPFAEECRQSTLAKVLTYGNSDRADWRLRWAAFAADGTRLRIENSGRSYEARTRLLGPFQLHNVLAAAVAVIAQGHEPEAVWAAISDFTAVRGRMERLDLPTGATAIIDYAHNPGGLETLLESCRLLGPRRLLLVFGCGGDRDRGKRPLMGEIAQRLAEGVWLTSDNPRNEDPQAILDDVRAGMSKRKGVAVEIDRAKAIEAALTEAAEGDLVVIAGKGHEDYQIMGTRRERFSDHDVIAAWSARVSGDSA